MGLCQCKTVRQLLLFGRKHVHLLFSKTTTENSIICGNPQREKKHLTKNLVSKLNHNNKNYNF